MDQTALSCTSSDRNSRYKPTSAFAPNRDFFFSGHERQDFIAVNGKLFKIEPWSLQPPDCWATHCVLTAMNFYKNLDSLQRQIVRAYEVRELEFATKACVDSVMNDFLVAMYALLDKNYYEPLASIKQVGLQTELVAKSFLIGMTLHRIHLTAKTFPSNDDTRLMLTQSFFASLDGVDDYLKFSLLPAEAHTTLSRLLKVQWHNERFLATEMKAMQIGEADIAFLVFVAVLDQAKQVLYRHEEYQLAQTVKDYRDSLAGKRSSTNDPNRLYLLYGLLADVADLVHEFCVEHASLRARHPNLLWKDVWNQEYVHRLLTPDATRNNQ